MLTPRQREVLEWIVAYIDHHGYSPTYREIARGMGLPSTNNVWQFVQSLKERGAIDYVPARARSIRVLSRLDDVPTSVLVAEIDRRRRISEGPNEYRLKGTL